jgi:internalin A
LKDVREAIHKLFSEENNKVMEKGNGIYVQIVQWEGLPEHISQDCKQGDYNEELKNCEVFLSLFWTKVGKYTEEEFDLAYSEFKANRQPYILYTYFKELALEKKATLSDDDLLSLLSFKKKLHNEIKHFQSNFTSITKKQ